MVKSELINAIAKRQPHLPLKDVEVGVNTILECLCEQLTKGNRIEIRGFGGFSLHYRPPRRAHNPKTGAHVYTQAKYTPHFKPGKELREWVNNSQHPIQVDNREVDTDDDSGSDGSGGDYQGGSSL